MGLGLSMIFLGNGHIMLGTLGSSRRFTIRSTMRCFKALLFLGAGAVLYRTHAHDLDQMGGLIHRMPVTALLFLIGCRAVWKVSHSDTKPLNGGSAEIAHAADEEEQRGDRHCDE